jgi:hypothetical protein
VEELLELYNVRILYDTPSSTQATIQWDRSSRVFQVWYYTRELTEPIVESDQPFPPDDGTVAPTGLLDVGTDELVVTIPAAGDILFVQLEPRDELLEAGRPFRLEIHPKGISSGADLPDGTVAARKLTEQGRRFFFDGDFSAVDDDTVQWTAGTLTLADGTEYTISAGNTGDMTVLTYVYFDATVSTTVLQTTTDLGSVLDDDVVLLCVCKPATSVDWEAFYVSAVGVLGLNREQLCPDIIGTTEITDDAITTPKILTGAVVSDSIATGAVKAAEIYAGAVDTSELAAGAVEAAKCNILILSAIAADVGTLTAGLIRNGDNTCQINLDASGNSNFINSTDFKLQADGDCTMSGSLSAATGSFAGSLSAATGSFAGSLSAADGTFEGSLQAATIYIRSSGGTIRGSINTGVAGTVKYRDAAGASRVETSASGVNLYGGAGGYVRVNTGLFDASNGSVKLAGSSSNLGFFGVTGTSKQTVTGSRGNIAALTSLLAMLDAYNLINDSTTA